MGIGIGLFIGFFILFLPAIFILRSKRVSGRKKLIWVVVALLAFPIYFLADAVLKSSLDPSSKDYLFQYMIQSSRINMVCVLFGWAVLGLFTLINPKQPIE